VTTIPGKSRELHDDEAHLLAALAAIDAADGRLDAAQQTLVIEALSHPAKPARREAAVLVARLLQAKRIEASPVAAQLEGQPAARWGAAFALARAGLCDDRVVDAAVAALGDSDGDVRWAASSIVSPRARVSEGLARRLAGLSRTGAPAVRKMALLCLCDSGCTDAALFRHGLDDDDRYVRLAALACLGRIADRSQETIAGVERIASSDPYPNVRRAACAILERRLTNPAPSSTGKE
jgi:hypothetical protein